MRSHRGAKRNEKPEQRQSSLAGWVITKQETTAPFDECNVTDRETDSIGNRETGSIKKHNEEVRSLENLEIVTSTTNIGTISSQHELPSSAEKSYQPDVEKAEKAGCMILKDGLCKTHNCMTKKVTVTAKKWKDRGKGRGYGYVNSKVTKNICMMRNEAPTVTTNYPGNLDLSITGGLENNGQE